MRVAAYRLQRVGRWGRKSALLDATTTDISRLARIKINNLCPSHFNACNRKCPICSGHPPHLLRKPAPDLAELRISCPAFGKTEQKLPHVPPSLFVSR